MAGESVEADGRRKAIHLSGRELGLCAGGSARRGTGRGRKGDGP